MDPLRDLSLFVEVARTKSFKKAAEHLDMPVSTVSRRLNELEKRLGVQLLNRTTRQVELTGAGQAFFQRCETIVEAGRAAIGATLEVGHRAQGLLHLSLPVDFGVTVLLPLIVEFGRLHPDVIFDLHFSSERVDLIADQYDLAIRFGALPDSGLTARRIAVVRRGLFAAPDYLKAQGAPPDPAGLALHSCILMPDALGQTRWTLKRAGESVEVTVRGRHVVNNVGALRALAMLGLGVACLDLVYADEPLQAGRLVRVLADWDAAPIDLYAVSTSRRSSAAARLLVDFLADHLTHC